MEPTEQDHRAQGKGQTHAFDSADGMPWNDGFLLGFESMDSVHREFVNLIHSMLLCPDEELLQLLLELERHVGDHFSQESEWMRSTSFPASGCHEDEHRAVQKSVRDVIPLLAAGDTKVARSLVRALAEWFPRHAAHLDSALAQWVVKSRTGGAPIVLKRDLGLAREVPALTVKS